MLPIRILTYNVCFGCMSGNDNDRTAQSLPSNCIDTTTGTGTPELKCLNNVKMMIQSADDYDFIGLQEATNWNMIFDHSKLQSKMGYICSTGGQAEIVTFYDKGKYKALATKCGDLDKSNGGRPYQITFFENSDASEKFIIINLHNGKGINFHTDNLQRLLSNNIHLGIVIPNDQYYTSYQEDNIVNITDILSSFDNCNTIVMGDFNDSRYQIPQQNYWEGFKPFNNVTNPRLSYLQNITVKSMSRPIKSCCNTEISNLSNRTYHSIGDYILIDTNKLEYTTENQIADGYDNTVLTSDHLPIKSIVGLKVQSHEPNTVADENSPVPEIKRFKIIQEKLTLQLLNINKNPADKKNKSLPVYDRMYKFKGDEIIRTNVLVYPNNRIVDVSDTNGSNQNQYIYVYDINDPNKIGYINLSYLDKIEDNPIIYKLKPEHKMKTLRLKPTNLDPNRGTSEANMIRGFTIGQDTEMGIPNGEVTNNGLVIVQDETDPSIIGYIQKSNLEEILPEEELGGGNYYHYIYNKQKYNDIKNLMII